MKTTDVYAASHDLDALASMLNRALGLNLRRFSNKLEPWYFGSSGKVSIDVRTSDEAGDGDMPFPGYPLHVEVSAYSDDDRVQLARRIFEALRSVGQGALLVDDGESKIDEFAPAVANP